MNDAGGRPDDAGDVGVVQRMIASASTEPAGHRAYSLHAGLTLVDPGGRTSSIQHDVHELVVVTAGALTMRLGDDVTVIVAGEHVVIEPGTWHSFDNDEGTVAAMVFAFGGDPASVTRRLARPGTRSQRQSTQATTEGAPCR